MVKKANWLKNVKKAWLPDVKKLKHQSVEETEISYPVLIARSRSSPPQFEVRVDEVNYEHKKKKNLSTPHSEEEEGDVLEDSTPSSPEFVPPPAIPDRFAGKSKEEAAAIFIQSTFRGHLARQESKRLRRLARLKLLMEGWVVQRQAANTLKSMQTITRMQSQIRSRRIRMAKENQVRHKQLLQKHAKELGGLKNSGNCNIKNQSKKQVKAGVLDKYEATMIREKELAYASTHQQDLKSYLKPTTYTMFMDPNDLTWGWSWLERWTAEKPLENSDKEQNKTVKPSVKTSTNRGEAAKSSNRRHNMVPTKPADEIAKSSEKNRRQIIIGRSSVSDDEGLSSSIARRHNMVPTKPPRGKLKAQSSASAATKTTTEESNGVVLEKAPAKKRASPAPKPRRSPAPPKVENNVLKAVKTPCA